ncbi:MAG TPA: cyclodeaminase/cyclohydrolase family protein [Bryobacteraceae bacterium]|nr:cyclodeaminase/cyclohydrolase family protein [Bryobacteraceae bacterium]
MNSSLWQYSLEDFGERVAGTDSTVAGAAVATVTAAWSAGLIAMVLRVIAARKDFAGDRGRVDVLIEGARSEAARLKKYADADPEAYAGYLQARRLPRNTDEEREAREEAMARALRRATAVPLAAARAAAAALELCQEAAVLASGPVTADLRAAALLLAGAISALLLTVDANLPSLGESPFAREAAAERGALEDRASRIAAALRQTGPA